MGAIHLVRHGQASFGAEDYDQLSPLGQEQSRLLGVWQRECGLSIDGVVTGSLKRHQQSAQACVDEFCRIPQADWTLNAGFDEFNHHEVLQRFIAELAEQPTADQELTQSDSPRKTFQKIFARATARWVAGQHDEEYAESWTVFRARCRAALNAVIDAAGTSRDIWIFTSGGAITGILQDLLEIPDSRILGINWTLVNGGVTKLLYRPGQISLCYLNNHAHLEKHHRPELITYR